MSHIRGGLVLLLLVCTISSLVHYRVVSLIPGLIGLHADARKARERSNSPPEYKGVNADTRKAHDRSESPALKHQLVTDDSRLKGAHTDPFPRERFDSPLVKRQFTHQTQSNEPGEQDSLASSLKETTRKPQVSPRLASLKHRGVFRWSNHHPNLVHGPLVSPLTGLFNLSDTSKWSKQLECNSTVCQSWNVQYQFVGHTPCVWRSIQGKMKYKGKFIVQKAWDQHLRGFNPTDLIQNRLHRIDQRKYLNNYFTFFATCEIQGLDVSLEEKQTDGVITVEGFRDFRAYTAAKLLHVYTETQPEDFICGRASYGDRFQPVSLLKYVKWYLTRWNFSRVIMYQIGADRSSDYDFDEFAGAELRELQNLGRLIFVDLRNELQNWFGHKAVEASLFSTMSLQMFIKMDCFLRAEAVGNTRWILSPDPDEFLFESGTRNETTYKTFEDFHKDFSSRHGTDMDWYGFGNLEASAHSSLPCTCAQLNVEEFVHSASMEHKRELNTGRSEASLRPFSFTELKNIRYWQGARGRRKYIVRLDPKRELRMMILGIHDVDLDHPVMYRYPNRPGVGLDVDPFHSLYIREYGCMHREFPSPCGVGGPIRFWDTKSTWEFVRQNV